MELLAMVSQTTTTKKKTPAGGKAAGVQPKPGTLSLEQGNNSIVILLVDDDADCRMLIRDAIAECKVSNRVYEVTNGQEALDYLHGKGKFAGLPRPGLVFLDLEMPGMDGQATLERIKADPGLRDIPVVMMTGVADDAEMKRAMANGANSYTLKPANAEQFLRTVLASTNYWLNVHQYPNHHLPPDACRR
jgi:two-component system response regulator